MTDRDTYADLLRIAAVFFVMLIHTVAPQWYSLPQVTYEWQMMNSFDSLSRWVVPLFIMLSGAYILDPKRELTLRTLYGKYILRVFAALIIWGLIFQIYTIVDAALYEGKPVDTAAFAAIPKKFIFGSPFEHLWYLYTIIGLYMLAPALRIYTAHAPQSSMKYLLLLIFAVGSVIPFINKILKNQGSTLAVYFKIKECTGFVFYYLAGYYFRTFEISSRKRGWLYAAGIAGAVATALLTSFYSIQNGAKTEDFYDNMMPADIAMTLAVFTVFKYGCAKKQYTEKQKNMAAWLSSCTFGMYLVHPLFIRIAQRLGITPVMFNPLFCAPLLTAAFYVLSLVVTALLRCIRPLRKCMV